ncbi:large subunit ribosomal protein L13 [Bacilli bacterium PM5-3]|nr:large subunit ribosomal protein L13 [Bacilli bacterium PM5-3]MDH6603756.1 large subunit ribosomal protein L13 [Bacilli bacterium PM5-9]
MRQTTMANSSTVERKWFVVDATDITLGRLSSQVATILRGKHKPTYTPNVDCGDYVIVLNADKIKLTGNKLEGKMYYNHSGHIGGLRVRTAKTMINEYPVEMLERAIKGMLPKNTLGRKQGMKLFVYNTNEHPHAAQQPEVLEIKG